MALKIEDKSACPLFYTFVVHHFLDLLVPKVASCPVVGWLAAPWTDNSLRLGCDLGRVCVLPRRRRSLGTERSGVDETRGAQQNRSRADLPWISRSTDIMPGLDCLIVVRTCSTSSEVTHFSI